MHWNELFGKDSTPSADQMALFVNNPLWGQMHAFLQETYAVSPQISYSSCSAQPGWNVKYRKSSKSLCTLYPMDGFFIALVVVGNREQNEADLLMPMCGKYVKELYAKTPFSAGGKWLMINVTESETLEDVKNLIRIRVKPPKVKSA